MDMPEPLKEFYDYLSVYNRRLLQYMDETPGGAEWELYEELFRVNTDVYLMQPWPVFVKRRAMEDIGEIAVKVYRLLRAVPFRIFGGDHQKISDYYQIPPALVNYFFDGMTQPDFDNLLARGDFIMTASGLKCIEYNVNTNLGGTETALWESTYLSVPIIRRFLSRQGLDIRNRELVVLMFRHMVENVVERFGDSIDEVNIVAAMEGTEGVETLRVFFESMFDKALPMVRPGLRGSFTICDYPDLTVTPEGVSHRGKRVHALMEMFMGYVPPRIREVFRDRKLLIYNGAATWIMSTKMNFALLSELEDSDIFTPDERETIKKHIPWTRKVAKGTTNYQGKEIDLLDFIYTNRERLVLKPVVGSGGKGIYIGQKTSDAEWRQVVEKSLNCHTDLRDEPVGDHVSREEWERLMDKALNLDQWLVQEYNESYPFLFLTEEDEVEPHYAAWGFFVFGDRFSGGWARVLPFSSKSGVVNSHQGAQVTLILETDE